MSVQPADRQVVYLVERLPPQQPEAPSALDKVREVAGTILAVLGLAILVGTTIAFAGSFLGWFVLQTETLHTVFMTGIVSAISGFHLAKGNGHPGPSAEFTAGPVAISI